MYLDTDKLAQKLHNASFGAKEIPLYMVWPMLSKAWPGHDVVDAPELYRWFLIKTFPTKDLEVTLKGLMDEAGSRASDAKWSHDRIVELLKASGQEWPAFVTADGIIVDGNHRIAAHRTLKDKNMLVVVAVRRPGQDERFWDEAWNYDFP